MKLSRWVVAGVLSCAAAGGASGQQIDVLPRDTGHPIAEAVAAAHAGSRIVIHGGVYREPTVVVDRPLTIEGMGDAVLDGDGTHGLFLIAADDVTVRGLTLRNTGSSFVEDRAALRVTRARGCVIADNRVERAAFGIYLSSVTDCRVERNVLRGTGAREAASGNGIHLWSSRRITIVGNRISAHRDGIYFEFVRNSHIRDNESTGNQRYGLHFMYSDDCRYEGNTFRENGAGVAVMYTKRVEMIGNRFESNRGAAAYGLLLKEISDSRLERNIFRGNTTALLADGANRLVAEHNEFIGNGWAVKLDANTEAGRIERNNFVGNTFDVATNSGSQTTTLSGNYWDAYRGYDLNRDGVGDVPHRPVRFFSVLVQGNPPAIMLLRSAFVQLLDAVESALPSLTPRTLVDATPAMRRLR